LSLADQVSHTLHVSAEDRVDGGPAFGVTGIELVGEEDSRNAVVVADQLGVSHEKPAELFEWVGCFAADRFNIAMQSRLDETQNGVEDIVLSGEMAVDCGGDEADQPGDA
jgi:hypothetical protein